jgi:hypothetical protein
MSVYSDRMMENGPNHHLQVIIKWRGKPVFVRHRTESEIKEAEDTKWEVLRDPQSDEQRVQKPEWLVMLGMGKSRSDSIGIG